MYNEKLLIRPRFLWQIVNRTGERFFFPFFPFVHLKLLFTYLLINFQWDNECSRTVTEQNPFWNGFFWCLEWSVRRLSTLCQGKPYWQILNLGRIVRNWYFVWWSFEEGLGTCIARCACWVWWDVTRIEWREYWTPAQNRRDLTRKIGFEQSTWRRPGVFNREYDDPMLCNQCLGSS